MGEKRKPAPACAQCEVEKSERACVKEGGTPGKHCPTLACKDLVEEAAQLYQEPKVMEFARKASIQESVCYGNRGVTPYIMQPQKTRILEICEFAHRMGYKKLGIAFCAGLTNEVKVVDEIFRAHGFETVSAVCKSGCVEKGFLGIEDKDKIRQGSDETMCNPVLQALLLNRAEADFNVLCGLCVGHDSLFFKYAEAPTTVLAVKDRVTGHNPLAAIYTIKSYSKKLMHPEICS